MQKIGGEVPEYGTIQQRMAVGISEYVDPKGRKPTAYFKIMKKYKLTEEQVQEEASKVNVVISPEHFVVPDDTKRGRPKVEKEEKEKGAKGRPKKTKKVLQIEGDDDDLFAALVAEANESDDESVLPKKKAQKSDEDKESDRLAKEVEKAHAQQEKEVKRLAEKEARDAKLAQEKSDRDEKKKAEEDTRAAKKKAEEDTRAAKKKAEEDAKEAKKLALEQAKSDKDSKKKKVVVAEPESTQEADVVKKIEYEGKKYLKSKNTGVIYDYIAYTKQEEQIVVGQWSDSQNKIIFNTSGEESEEEYDE